MKTPVFTPPLLKLHDPQTDIFRLLSDEHMRMVQEVLAQREEILKAFVAKYGFEPDNAIQVIDERDGKIRWSVQRKEPMTIREAYDSLCKYLGRPGWLSSVGMCPDKIIVYLRTERHPKLPETWGGYPVEPKFFGEFAPLGEVP